MDNLNYDFFEEFKHLDKLCKEIYNDQYGVTHYIDDMKAVSKANYRYIPNWENDLEQLIRLRHIRNNLAHAEDAFNEEECKKKDIDWIREFYERILNQSDPMAILYQNTKVKNKTPKQFYINNKSSIQIDVQANVKLNNQVNTKAYVQKNVQVHNKTNEKMKISQWIVIFLIIAAAIALIVGSVITMF